MTTRIVFNGQEYASLDAMPPDVRQAYDQIVKQLGDADHDGVPDIIQHGIRSNFLDITRSVITINGKTYDSRDQMPASARKLYDDATRPPGRTVNRLPMPSGPSSSPTRVSAPGPSRCQRDSSVRCCSSC